MTDDRWAAGDAYEAFMGRWSARLAEAFVRWLNPEPQLHWLDVGCGTGALTAAICGLVDPRSVTACDPSAPFVERLQARIRDPRVSAMVAGAEALPERPGGFDRVVSSLVLNFLADPRRSVEDMRARIREGGTVAATVWDYGGGMEFLRHFWDAAAEIDPGARDLDEGVRFPMCRPDTLESIFRDGGLTDVRSTALDVPTRFDGFPDYWQPFLGGTGPAPAYAASLDERKLGALRARLEARLAARPGGIIELTARAWGVRGTAV